LISTLILFLILPYVSLGQRIDVSVNEVTKLEERINRIKGAPDSSLGKGPDREKTNGAGGKSDPEIVEKVKERMKNDPLTREWLDEAVGATEEEEKLIRDLVKKELERPENKRFFDKLERGTGVYLTIGFVYVVTRSIIRDIFERPLTPEQIAKIVRDVLIELGKLNRGVTTGAVETIIETAKANPHLLKIPSPRTTVPRTAVPKEIYKPTTPPVIKKPGVVSSLKSLFTRFGRGLLWSLPLGTITGPEEELGRDFEREGVRLALQRRWKTLHDLILQMEKLAVEDPEDPALEELRKKFRAEVKEYNALLDERREFYYGRTPPPVRRQTDVQ